MVFLLFTYLLATEKIAAKKSRGEILVFRRATRDLEKNSHVDTEGIVELGSEPREKSAEPTVSSFQRQTAIYHWKDICFDIPEKKGSRRLLDHVDGWVKPGTLTALMVSVTG